MFIIPPGSLSHHASTSPLCSCRSWLSTRWPLGPVCHGWSWWWCSSSCCAGDPSSCTSWCGPSALTFSTTTVPTSWRSGRIACPTWILVSTPLCTPLWGPTSARPFAGPSPACSSSVSLLPHNPTEMRTLKCSMCHRMLQLGLLA